MVKNTKQNTEKDSDLVKSMREFVDFLKGKEDKCDVSVVFNDEIINIKKIREGLSMNRKEFAKTFGFTVRSLENWESGARRPNNHTLAYFKLIMTNPLLIRKMLVD